MELVHVWRFDFELLFEEHPPLNSELPVNQVSHNKELIIFGTLESNCWRFNCTSLWIHTLVIDLQNKLVRGQCVSLLVLLHHDLHKFKVHKVELLYILDFYGTKD